MILRCFAFPATTRALLLAGLLVASPTAAESPEPRNELRDELRQLIVEARDRVYPALVNIEVVTVGYFYGQENKGGSVGSGTILSEEGYVLTNQHVTANGRKFRCTLADKQTLDAEMVGEDPLTDLAVLKLDLSQWKGEGPLPSARFGRSADLEVGDTVLAMGSPFALSRSVTLGIVSNKERVFAGGLFGGGGEEMELEPGQRTGLFTRWIQHDALINPGNSGGPLVNLDGEIVGVNELGGDAIGFAIPSELAQEVAQALIAHGEVPRSWIGASFRSLKGTGYGEGVLISGVEVDSPAERAGLRVGDLLTAIDGDAVSLRFAEELPLLAKRIADLPVGKAVELTYRRPDRRNGEIGEAQTLDVTTEKLEKDLGREAAFRAWGITAAEITGRIARRLRVDDATGVMISGVRDGSPAQLAEPPLGRGDVLRRVDGEAVVDFADFTRRYAALMSGDELPEKVFLDFERQGKSLVTVIEPRGEDLVQAPRELPKAWLGVATQPVTRELAAALGGADRRGFRVTRIYPGTTAADSALAVGDIIRSLDGKRLEPRGLQDSGLLSRSVRRLEIGAEVDLEVLRDGEPQMVSVALDRSRLQPNEARREKNAEFELVVRELTFFDRDTQRWGPSVRGVLVDQVETAGWAGLAGLQVGDLLQEAGGRPVRGLRSFEKALTELAAEKPERVVFVVLRGARTRYLYLEPEWAPVSGAASQETSP